MERATVSLELAKSIMGDNFIGPLELISISEYFPVSINLDSVPEIPFSEDFLVSISNEYILIWGDGLSKNEQPLNLKFLRELYGINAEDKEPCFYNQDWYLNENFFLKTLERGWYLIAKQVSEITRAVLPEKIEASIENNFLFPTAILTAYTFFAWYFYHPNDVLWKHDFLWCSDKDINGDRIYTGRYLDDKGISKNGFSIHRHLSLRPSYALAPQIRTNL